MSGVVTVRSVRLFMLVPRDEIRKVTLKPVVPTSSRMQPTDVVLELAITLVSHLLSLRFSQRDMILIDDQRVETASKLFEDLISDVDVDVRWEHNDTLWTRTEHRR